MPIYSIISAEKGRQAGDDGIYIHVDEHDMPSEYEYYPGHKELFGNGLYFIHRSELYESGMLGGIDEDIPKKLIKNPEKYMADVDALTGKCIILPVSRGSSEKKAFSTNFRF